MSDNVAPHSSCHLLGLPSEIRLLIYEALFPPRSIDMTDNELGLDTAILETCRTIYKEAKPVLYENTEFLITLRAEGRHVGPCDDNSENAKRMRPLFKLARKLSLTIKLGSSRKRKLRKMASELTRLDEAPHLKELHITFENSYAYRAIQWQFDLAVGMLGLVTLPTDVTVMLDPSMTTYGYDFQLSKWFHSLDKLNWIDTTYRVYTKQLTGYDKEVEDIRAKLAEVMAWVASSGSEGHDAVLAYGREHFDVEWDLMREVQFSDPNITVALDLAESYEQRLFDLRDEISCSPLGTHLGKYAAARAAYEEAKKRPVA